MKIDLHMHSNFSSDGQHSVEEILQFVKSAGVNIFSLTDHNTVMGVECLLEYCSPTDRYEPSLLNFVTGIELSTYYKETEIHLLAYGISPKHDELAQIIKEFKVNRMQQAKLRVEALQQMGMTIGFDELIEAAEGKTASGVTFLNVLKRYPENYSYISDYIDGDKSDSPYTNFYFDFFFRGGKAFVYVPLLDYTDVIDRLKDKAVLVLAHPGLYPAELIDALAEHAIDGIEVYSSYHDDDKISYFESVAEKHNLFITSGSDFHGELIKPGIEVGSVTSPDSGQVQLFIDQLQSKRLMLYQLSHN